ncbi:MAG: hypothetical protein R2932_27720 [Caldilineaceae bacterium]
MTEPTLLESNQMYRYEINVGVTAQCFPQGTLRPARSLFVQFPPLRPQLNTGETWGMSSEVRVARRRSIMTVTTRRICCCR